jgi:type IV pilus assembly protein PilE
MQKHPKPPRANLAGFTLIELMVTVAVVAILGTIAMTSYTSQIQKSRRTDARSAIMDLAGREEKLFSTTNAYSATPSDLGYVGVWPIAVGSNYYQVTVTIPTPTSYLIKADAINSQAGDTTCASLSVDQLGTQASIPAANATTCWGN